MAMDIPNHFRCGSMSCPSPGFYFCVQYPFVKEGEEECWKCELKNHTCGTEEQQYGCELYCHGQSKNTTEPDSQDAGSYNIMAVYIPLLVLLIGVAIATCYCVYKRRKNRMNNDVENGHESNQTNSLRSSIDSTPLAVNIPSNDDMEEKVPLTSVYSETAQEPQENPDAGSKFREQNKNVTLQDKFNQVNPSSQHPDSPPTVTTNLSRHG